MLKKFALYIALAYAISWFFWGIGYMVVEGYIPLEVNQELFMIMGRFGPSLVGLLILRKHRSLKGILRNIFLIRTSSANVFVIFFLMPILFGITFIVALLLGHEDSISTLILEPLTIVIVYLYVLFLGGPLAEEIGWRGGFTKLLLKKYKPLTVALIIGFLWSTWHLPLFFIPGNVQAGIPIPIYYAYTIILAVIMMVLIIKTKQISSAIYFHTSANVSIGVFYVVESSLLLLVVGSLLAVSCAVLLYRNWGLLMTRQDLSFQTLQEK